MADKYGAPSMNKIKGQGGFKAPPAGYMKTSDSIPGGKPSGKTPEPGSGPYTKGVHVKGIGSSAGNVISKPKAFKASPTC